MQQYYLKKTLTLLCKIQRTRLYLYLRSDTQNKTLLFAKWLEIKCSSCEQGPMKEQYWYHFNSH